MHVWFKELNCFRRERIANQDMSRELGQSSQGKFWHCHSWLTTQQVGRAQEGHGVVSFLKMEMPEAQTQAGHTDCTLKRSLLQECLVGGKKFLASSYWKRWEMRKFVGVKCTALIWPFPNVTRGSCLIPLSGDVVVHLCLSLLWVSHRLLNLWMCSRFSDEFVLYDIYISTLPWLLHNNSCWNF